jgi:hypothetical protein
MRTSKFPVIGAIVACIEKCYCHLNLSCLHDNCRHIKSVNRISCVDSWHNEHCPTYREVCPFGKSPKDPENHTLACQSWTPWIDNYYPTAQLNHYWTLSLADFLRKIHRGKGGSYSKRDGADFRNTGTPWHTKTHCFDSFAKSAAFISPEQRTLQCLRARSM